MAIDRRQLLKLIAAKEKQPEQLKTQQGTNPSEQEQQLEEDLYELRLWTRLLKEAEEL